MLDPVRPTGMGIAISLHAYQSEGVINRLKTAPLKGFGPGGGYRDLDLDAAPYHFVPNIAQAQEGPTIKVGILHSLSGTIAIIERSLHNAELLAIEEINAHGGVLGKPIEAVVEEPQSMVQVFNGTPRSCCSRIGWWPCSVAALQPGVSRCCRCSRSTMACCSIRPCTRRRNAAKLLLHRGGAEPAARRLLAPVDHQRLGRKRFYLIGADYIYPKETNREVKALLQKFGGENGR